jgi:hypothetical protein
MLLGFALYRLGVIPQASLRDPWDRSLSIAAQVLAQGAESPIVAGLGDSAAETKAALGLVLDDARGLVMPLLPGGREAEARARAARAYRNAFGRSMDEDLTMHRSDVEAWIVQWQGAYDTGEYWAWALLVGPEHP